MRDIVSDIMVGSSMASIGLLIAKFNGFNWISLSVILYLVVFTSVVSGFKSRLDLSNGLLHRIVLVAEGEELKMKKLFTGEKYKVKGDVEKI